VCAVGTIFFSNCTARCAITIFNHESKPADILFADTNPKMKFLTLSLRRTKLWLPVAIINRHAEKPEDYSRQVLVVYPVASLLR